MKVEQIQRKDVLLRAAYDLLTKLDRGEADEAMGGLIRYDEANCDGSCLRDDIAIELDIEPTKDPIPLRGRPAQ